MALLKDHLIAHYKMNDHTGSAIVVDSSGNGRIGEYQLNNVAQDTDTCDEIGKINRALDFVGGVNGEMIVIPDHNDFSPAESPFSISAWVYMHDAINFVIASKGVPGALSEWKFMIDLNSKLYFVVYDDSDAGYILVRSGDNMPTNQWINVIATYDGSVLLNIYLNGEIVVLTRASLTFTAVENLAAPVYLGRYETFYANGLIDNVMFFNKELTLNDIKALYNNGAGRETIPIGIENHLSRTGHRFSSFPEN